MRPDGSHHTATLRDHARVLRRRKLAFLMPLLVAPAVAVAFSLSQPPRYEASAEVLLSRQNLAASLTGATDPSAYEQAERVAETQAEIARVPLVAERVLRITGVRDRSIHELLASSEVQAKDNADLLEFRVRDGSAELATRLATAYASEFARYRGELDTTALRRTREGAERRLADLVAAGERKRSPLYRSLAETVERLRTMEALRTDAALVIRTADKAEQVSPQPIRDGLLGLGLGVLLAIGLAFLRESVDTRVRSAEEIGEILGLPLLARLEAPSRRLRKRNRLVMLEEPNSVQAEAFRMLRTNLDFVNLERGCATIMVTSAVQSEGKSTTVANLAVALARAGRRVVLVDLDLRRPYLDRFFPGRGRLGLTDVALGYGRLGHALVPVSLDGGNGRQARAASESGTLEVVTAGPIPPDGAEFIGSRALATTLEELRARCDVLLIDAPPLLRVGDGMALSTKVDGLLLVARLSVIRRPMLRELRRLLDACPTEKLGFVVTGANLDDSYPYDYGEYTTEAYTYGERELVG